MSNCELVVRKAVNFITFLDGDEVDASFPSSITGSFLAVQLFASLQNQGFTFWDEAGARYLTTTSEMEMF